jgi:hypothetical protein
MNCTRLLNDIIIAILLKLSKYFISWQVCSVLLFCACFKPGPWISISICHGLFFTQNCLMKLFFFCFVDIGRIVDHHCLNFVLINLVREILIILSLLISLCMITVDDDPYIGRCKSNYDRCHNGFLDITCCSCRTREVINTNDKQYAINKCVFCL